MAVTQEKIYALHEFVAENPDEVSFKVGEVISVIEKDDTYGDGWWQVSLWWMQHDQGEKRKAKVQQQHRAESCLVI